MRKKISLGFLTGLSALLVFSNFSEVFASHNQIDVKEKITLYKLDLMQDVFEIGDNEITYHWIDLDSVEQSVDLIVTLDEVGTISSVKEINISDEELEEIQKSIEQKDNKITTMASPVPYKLNGGMTESQFLDPHTYSRHQFDNSVSSTCSRTRYGRHVGVKEIRLQTINAFDEKFSSKQGDNSTATYFSKNYNTIISQENGVSTSWHRVIKIDGAEATHHPLCK
ncbi:hypothetical protein ACTHO0_27715 [Cytobacillus praedii]|uniref:hypothetical protein n=1 Tax=Cytobacillus praedii TaxID=1742358 RepID=UPI003F822315